MVHFAELGVELAVVPLSDIFCVGHCETPGIGVVDVDVGSDDGLITHSI